MIIFNQNPFLNKLIISLLLMTIFLTLVTGALFYPKKAQATVPTFDWKLIATTIAKWAEWFAKWAKDYALKVAWFAWEKMEAWRNHALKIASAFFRRALLDYMVNQIVQWVQGDRGGGVKIIPDWKEFIATAADVDIRDFLNELGLGFLCDPFAPQLRIALEEPRLYRQIADCTLDDMVRNIQNFYNDFSQGGWKAWITITQPWNNFYGSYLIALDEKERRRALAVKASLSKAESGAGVLGDERCTRCYWIDLETGARWNYSGSACEEQIPPDQCLTPEVACDFICTQTQIRTPGKIVADTLQEGLVKDIKWLEENEEWESYVVAIVDALINRLTREGVNWITSDDVTGAAGGSPGSPYYVSPSQEPGTPPPEEEEEPPAATYPDAFISGESVGDNYYRLDPTLSMDTDETNIIAKYEWDFDNDRVYDWWTADEDGDGLFEVTTWRNGRDGLPLTNAGRNMTTGNREIGQDFRRLRIPDGAAPGVVEVIYANDSGRNRINLRVTDDEGLTDIAQHQTTKRW